MATDKALTLRSTSSPFVSVLPLDVEVFAPTFERTGMPNDPQRAIIVAHQDFHGVVTSADPAIPGETVHAYMSGLGGTQPIPPTGSPPMGLAYASPAGLLGNYSPQKSGAGAGDVRRLGAWDGRDLPGRYISPARSFGGR